MKKFFQAVRLGGLLVGIMLMTSISQAQYNEVGFGLGTSLYWGDLNAPQLNENLSNMRLAGQLSLRYNHSKYLSFRTGLLIGKLNGDDRKSDVEWQRIRNLRFSSILAELSLMGEFNVFGLDYHAGNVFTPYVTAGLAGFYFNPTTDFNGARVALQPLGTEGQGLPGFNSKYNRVAFAVPFGAGAKFAVTERWCLNLGVVARFTFTDYLDDVSTSYVNYNELSAGNGELSATLANRQNEFLGQTEPVLLPTGSQRGGESVRDYYFTFIFAAYYYLGPNNFFSKRTRTNTSSCPTF